LVDAGESFVAVAHHRITLLRSQSVFEIILSKHFLTKFCFGCGSGGADQAILKIK
jgi:hypothetical protein